MSSSVFSETLQEITTTKLSEVFRRRTIFEEQKAALLRAAHTEINHKYRLAILSEGLKQCFAVKTAKRKRDRVIRGSTEDPALVVLLKNFDRFIDQARYDPSISTGMMANWEITLKKRLNIQSLKYEYAALYGQLVTEWLSAEEASTPTSSQADTVLKNTGDVPAIARDVRRPCFSYVLLERKPI